MRLVAAIGIATVFALLSGCVTRCGEQTYFKPDASGAGSAIRAGRSSDGLGGIEFTVDRAVYVDLSECGGVRRGPEGGAVTLCITVIPERDVLVNFEESTVRFLDRAGAETATAKIEKMRYSIFCLEDGSEPRCSSTLASPGESETERSRVRMSERSHSIGVEVSPVRAWPGAGDTQYGVLVVHRATLRQYQTTVAFPRSSQTEVTVAMPAIVVNGRRYALPNVTFRKVTETSCMTFA